MSKDQGNFGFSVHDPFNEQPSSCPGKNITVKYNHETDLSFFLQEEDVKSKPREGKNAIRKDFKIGLIAP